MRPLCWLLLIVAAPAQAEWRDLWRTPDQQAQQAFDDGDHAAAAKQFSQPLRRGAAYYRDGQYDKAVEAYGEALARGGSGDAELLYNRGTALARAGDLEAALGALELAAELDPSDEDVSHNRDWVRRQLQRQSPQDSPSEGEQGDGDQQQGESGEPQSADDRAGGEKGKQAGEQSDSASGSPSDAEQSDADESDDSAPADAEPSDGEDADTEQSAEATAAQPDDSPLSESEQATRAWLRQIPDDPSLLLREKMKRMHQREYSRVGDDQQPW